MSRARPPQPADEDDFLRVRLGAVFPLVLPMIAMDLLGSCMIAWFYWQPRTATALTIWLAVSALVLTPRVFLAYAFRRGLFPRWSMRRWATWLTTLAGASGVMWSLAMIWMFAVGTDNQVAFVLCVALSGITLTIVNIAYWPVYAVFAGPVTLSAGLGYALSNRPGHGLLAFGAVSIAIAMLWTSRRLAREVLRGHRLAIENRALAESLLNRGRELEQACHALEQVSRTDPLTGLANRRSRDGRLNAEWERAIRFGSTLTVIAIDVDHFKHYNDAHGHAEGDRCLQAVAEVLNATIRGPIDLATRHGGEEFMLVMPGIDADAAASIAERVRVRIATCHNDPGFDLPDRVTVSLGVATISPAAGRSVHELTIAADAALYRAKMAGRNRYEMAPSLDSMKLAAIG
jgi:diguanylate cyclase (GGDEF)-like protein